MLDTLYLVCIAPLEVLMRLAFDLGMTWFHSAGLAILFMSLAVNTVLLPIYTKAEGWQEEERELKKRMAPKEQMIHRCFRGQERFAMLSTLYRQFGYSPFMTLRASIGLLLQIPFFFAAYHLLSHMPALDGVSFGPVRNLGAPDGLLAIGGVSINVLPLLMTAVNLASAFFYTHGLSRRDKIQLYGMAALFLVLLYTSPAGLVFYWTLNNVYSLGKNIVEKRLLPAWRADRAKEQMPDASGAGIRAVQGVLAVVEKCCPAGRLAWCLLVASVAGIALVHTTSVRWEPTRTLLLFGLEIVSLWLVTGMALRMGKLRESCPGVAFLVLTVTLWFAVTASLNIWAARWGMLNRWITLILCWSVLPFLGRCVARLGTAEAQEHSSLALFAWNMLCLLCFVAVPVAIYVSDPEALQTPLCVMLPELEAYGLAAALAGSLVLRALPAGDGALMAFFTSSAALGGCAYAVVFTGDYGVLNGFFLERQQALLNTFSNGWRDAVLLLAVCGTSAAALLCRKTAWLRYVCGVLCLTLGIGSVWQIASITKAETKRFAMYESDKKQEGSLLATPPADLLPAYTTPLLEFSSTEKNLLIIVLDMFTGDHFPYLLEDFPELKEGFAGFVWYPDTLTAGSGTVFGLHAIPGGDRYTLWNINKRRDAPVSSQYAKSYTLLPGLLAPLGFECSLGGVHLTTGEAVRKELPQGVEACVTGKEFFRDYARYWRALQQFSLPETRNARFLLAVSLFKCAPYSLRRFFYQGGTWRLGELEINTAETVHSYGALDSLATAASARAKQATYKYLYFSSTHTGNIFSPETGLPMREGEVPQADTTWIRRYPAIANHGGYPHFIAEWASLRSLARFFAWMKENGVWDNTRIIIASDHGSWDSQALYDSLGLVPERGRLQPATTNPGLAYALLLFKDFNASGDVRISREYMSNADVPEMLVEGITTLDPALQSGYTLRARPDRKRFYFSSDHFNQSKTCVPGYVYQVTGTMFNKQNWTLQHEELCH